MTFPSDKDIKFFAQPEAREFFGARWKPAFGDWALTPDGIGTLCLIDPAGVGNYVSLKDFGNEENEATSNPEWYEWGELILLPRPDQLLEMLEEKEYSIVLDTCDRGSVSVDVFIMEGISLEASATGPTPAITLAKCVMKTG